jgi:CheY-like chemotaxis protein
MQYVEGSDLAAILSEQGRLRPYRAIDVCRQIGSALDAAHARGLIHRDVKPANVLIEGRTADLTDFGLTKRLAAEGAPITHAGDVVGTIHYVAPEQIEGAEVTPRTDVYSLGCVLYHCLTGDLPYERDNDIAVIYAHLSEEPPRPSQVRTDLPDGLDGVIAKALDKSPDRRFGTCGDLMSAARAVVDAAGPLGETIPPRRTGSVQAGIGPAIEGMRDAAAAARRARVLLAGVAPSTRAIARVALGERVDVHETSNVASALEAARDRRPDLVILDSAEIVGAFRADPLTRDAKILLVVDESTGRDPLAAGADERLEAPFSPLQLQVKLRKLLGADVVGT